MNCATGRASRRSAGGTRLFASDGASGRRTSSSIQAASPRSRALRSWSTSHAVCGIGTISPSKSEEHTSELQSLMSISYAVFCLKEKNYNTMLTTLVLNNYELRLIQYTYILSNNN